MFMDTRCLLLSAVALGALSAQPALAQAGTSDSDSDQEGASSPSPGENGGQLDVIIVTAQRRAENVQSVPIAISVIGAEELQRRNMFDASQLQYAIPSIQQQSKNNQVGAANFSIRGVGTTVYGQVEAAVGVVIDDVPLARPALGVVQFFDLDRVEVLRGPQGMLFGKNASAGLINITTAKPRIGETSGLAHLSWGKANSGTSGNEAIAQVALNVPVSADSALRVSGFVTRQDGFGRNINMSENLGLTEFGARAKFLWNATDHLEIYASGDYAKENGPGGSVLFRRADAPVGFIEAQNSAVGITASPTNTNIASDAPTDNRFELGGVQARTTYSFDSGYSIVNIAAWRAYHDRSMLETDQLPIDFFNVNNQGRDQRQFSNELRVASPSGGKFELQAGLYYLYIRDSGLLEQGANLLPVFPPVPLGFTLFGGRGNVDLINRSYAAFAQGKLEIAPTFHITLGGRITHDDIKGIATGDTTGYVIPNTFSGTISGTLKETNFSFRASAEYNISPQVLAYATFARGYKAPSFGGSTGLEVVKPEIPKNIEVGLKSTLFDNRLVFNLAAYHVLFKNYQAQAFDPVTLGFPLTNAGDVRAQGIEVDVRARPIEGLTLSGGLAFNDAIYKNYAGVGCYYGQPTGTSGRNVCLPNQTVDVTGNNIAFAPKLSASLAGQYEQAVGQDLKAFLTANLYYRSSVNFTAVRDPQTRVAPYAIVGGSFGVETGGGTRLSIFARNLFDKRVPTFIVADITSPFNGDAALGGDYWQQFGETSFRTVGVSFDTQF